MLDIDDLSAGYGQGRVLQGVTLRVAPGEIVALIGRNGSGRSTLVKAVMGRLPATGSVRWRGRELLGLAPHRIARLGLGCVPEGREIFPGLTVHQNLLLGEKPAPHARAGQPERWPLDAIYAMFPALQARQHTPAGVLSGGEQQMLALCRTLRGDPDLILVDEPTEGLAPQLVAQVAELLGRVRQRGVGVLLVEQKLAIALEVADRCLLMGHGRIVFEGTPAELRGNMAARQEWLEV
ncbi:MAG: hypothetical protein RLZZ592_1538 [Pseudomonadota bacterium]